MTGMVFRAISGRVIRDVKTLSYIRALVIAAFFDQVPVHHIFGRDVVCGWFASTVSEESAGCADVVEDRRSLASICIDFVVWSVFKLFHISEDLDCLFVS